VASSGLVLEDGSGGQGEHDRGAEHDRLHGLAGVSGEGQSGDRLGQELHLGLALVGGVVVSGGVVSVVVDGGGYVDGEACGTVSVCSVV
jgi:hypothetical protein